MLFQSKTKKSTKLSKRLGAALVERGLAPDEKRARAYVLAGQVIVNDQRIDKPFHLVSAGDQLRVRGVNQFVSRGGDKLEGALQYFGLTDDFVGSCVLDVGSSTGGFTDCVLKHGAAKIVAVDVGTNQLAWSLRSNPKVSVYEKTDIRDFASMVDFPRFDWILADVSFVSLAKILPSLVQLSSSDTRYLLLLKPQFELQPGLVPKGGVVSDPSMKQLAMDQILEETNELGLVVKRCFNSNVPGRRGNVEMFLLVEMR